MNTINLTKETDAEVKANMVAKVINNLGVEAEVRKVFKNGIERFGITLGSGTVRPTLYINTKDTRTIEEIADGMIEQYNSLPENNYSELVTDIMNYESIKEKLIPCVMKAKEEGLVMRKFLDMNVYYRFVIEDKSEGITSVKVTEGILEKWGITKTELHKQAVKNCEGTFGATDVMSMLMGLGMEIKTEDFSEFDNNPMFVITNESKTYGAAGILYNNLFKAIADDLHSDLFIIPSSIHELIVSPMELGVTAEEMTTLIQEVNATQVVPEEVLNDHIYFFRREVGKVEAK